MTGQFSQFTCHALPGTALKVTAGANLGDVIGDVDELCPGDTYRLDPAATGLPLVVADGGDGAGRVFGAGHATHRLLHGSELGADGATISLAARLTLLTPEGDKVDLLALDIAAPHGSTTAILPLAPIEPARDHILVGIDTAPGAARLTDITSMAFARGTRITLADGRQSPVETLSNGARILTRDHGPQTLRWIAHRTMRAVGPYAPVVVPKDMLGNPADLVLSQHQRLFIYQRHQERLTESAEILVRAHYLVDDDRITIRRGGFVDYYTLVFDAHEVIYAECVPVESLEVSAATLPVLAEDLAQEVGAALPDLDHVPHAGVDADRSLGEATRARLLKRGQP